MQRLRGTGATDDRPARPATVRCQQILDTKTATPGRRERRVRRVPPPRHPRLQPPRRRRRHRGHRRHGRLADDLDHGHPRRHHRPAHGPIGYSWADIGLRLGVTRQAAQQRWGGEPHEHTTPGPRRRSHPDPHPAAHRRHGRGRLLHPRPRLDHAQRPRPEPAAGSAGPTPSSPNSPPPPPDWRSAAANATTGPIAYPMTVLIAAAILSLSAQVAAGHAQPHRLARRRRPGPGLPRPVQTRPLPHRSSPGIRASPATTPPTSSRRRPAPLPRRQQPMPEPPAQLLTSARMAAFTHRQATGQTITADTLASHLAIPPALAGSSSTPWTAPPPTAPVTAVTHQRHPDHAGAVRDRIPARCWLSSPEPARGPGTGANTSAAHLHRPRHRVRPRPRRLLDETRRPARRRQLVRPARLLRLARSHLVGRRMHPPRPAPRRPPRLDPATGEARSAPYSTDAMPDRVIYKAVRQPPHRGLPVLRRDLPPRRLPAHPRRPHRRQRRPRDRRHPPGRVRHLHRPLLRPRPHPARPPPHLHRPGPLHLQAAALPRPPRRRDLPARPARWPASPATAPATRARPAAVPGLLRLRRPRRLEQRRRGTVAAHQASHRTPPRPARPPPRLCPRRPSGSPHGKAAEYQARGAVHFHVLLRLDGLDPDDPAPASAPTGRHHRRRPRGRHPPRRRPSPARPRLTQPAPAGRLAHRLGRRARRPRHHHAGHRRRHRPAWSPPTSPSTPPKAPKSPATPPPASPPTP